MCPKLEKCDPKLEKFAQNLKNVSKNLKNWGRVRTLYIFHLGKDRGGCIYYVVVAYKNDVRRAKKKVRPPPDCTKKMLRPTPEANKKTLRPPPGHGESTTNFVIYHAIK